MSAPDRSPLPPRPAVCRAAAAGAEDGMSGLDDGALSVRAAAAEAPGRLALLTADAALSYDALARAVTVAMRDLRHRGACSMPRAAVVAGRDLPTAVGLLALFELGVPVVLLHERAPAGECAALCQRTGATVVDARAIGHAALAARSPGRDDAPLVPADARPLAIVFTSGSSGQPRAVELGRRAFTASAAASAARLSWREQDRWLCALPLAHVGGLSILTRCLSARRTAVLDTGRFDPLRLAGILDTAQVTLLSLVPAMLRRLLDEAPTWRSPAQLRALLLGGAASDPALLSRARDRDLPLRVTYGMSETCSQVATQDTPTPLPPGCVGRPLPGIELAIDGGGRIRVRGPTLMNRYLPPAAPGIAADGWFETGDCGWLDADGRLHVTGRADDTIITGGENVHPAEVENVLAAHPGVREVCVIGLPDALWGQVVTAVVIPRAELDPATLAAHCAVHLSPFKRPRRFHLGAELPRLPSGKVDRAGLRSKLASSTAAPRGHGAGPAIGDGHAD
jgi:O-succinylbenzoic acid--CoA ligase